MYFALHLQLINYLSYVNTINTGFLPSLFAHTNLSSHWDYITREHYVLMNLSLSTLCMSIWIFRVPLVHQQELNLRLNTLGRSFRVLGGRWGWWPFLAICFTIDPVLPTYFPHINYYPFCSKYRLQWNCWLYCLLCNTMSVKKAKFIVKR